MDKELTEIIFILDRSGSMVDLTNDTIGGFNSFIEKQKLEPGKARLTTVLFDDRYEILHDCVDINLVSSLTDKEYFARGLTALLDAIGKTINSVGNRLNNTKENNRPDKVVFVITTDGYENASKEFTKQKIKDMIEHQTNKYNWTFLFFGATIDAIDVATSYGINFATNYSPNPSGIVSLYNTVCDTVSDYRSTGTITEAWNNDIK